MTFRDIFMNESSSRFGHHRRRIYRHKMMKTNDEHLCKWWRRQDKHRVIEEGVENVTWKYVAQLKCSCRMKLSPCKDTERDEDHNEDGEDRGGCWWSKCACHVVVIYSPLPATFNNNNNKDDTASGIFATLLPCIDPSAPASHTPPFGWWWWFWWNSHILY